ncbi:glycosyltransferase [Tessaracoccus sp. MC1679]|uniref:glycosyltransferase family 4 protein n=1 Tax=Tessaracoccus sp. MC1679 TaxID=2760313 RepID=UPI001602CC62|nr:glycosyltransferase [Tessaracoccus sp. MC1679]
MTAIHGRDPQGERRPRLVVLSHAAPRSQTGNAGQNYLSARVRHWQAGFDVRCILLQGRSAREDLDEALCPVHVLAKARRGRWRQALSNRVRRTFVGVADPAVARDLRADAAAREWLAEADVVALEWQEMAGHARTVRELAPRAQIVSVLHDVVSQSVDRKRSLSGSLRERLKWSLVGAGARAAERWIMRTSDVAVVLSEKDRGLLPRGRARVAVVPPAIDAPAAPRRRPEPNRTIMVASWRQEDLTGLRWFLDEVLPLVQGAGVEPDIHLIGRMAEEAQAQLRNEPITISGFVPSITSEYESAAVAIVPLQLGAGVKFKTVEAILHRVPIVTTPVGAEGVRGLEGTAKVSGAAAAFADRLAWILRDPAAAQAEADALAEEVAKLHSMAAFHQSMRELL